VQEIGSHGSVGAWGGNKLCYPASRRVIMELR
jgi:hypothetical protein